MATPVEIQGTDAQAKIRNPLGVVALSFVTLGIYFVFWYYFVNKEMAAMGRARNSDELGDSPGTSVLAVTLGALVIVPAFISLYNAWKRLNSGERLTTLSGIEPGLGLILWIFISPVAEYIFQSNWNKVLEAQTRGAPAYEAPASSVPASDPPPVPVP
ncbi:MAG TPA: DUF4234 domain-containing protein [Solirubrobacteraceae bacterium]|jgi:hypothetical protein